MSETPLSLKAREALRHLRNAVMHTGKVPSVRQLMEAMEYKSPRSAMLLMEELTYNGFLRKKPFGGYQLMKDLADDEVERTVDVPLVGSVPCGVPMLAIENVEAMISVSTKLARSGSKYFLLNAIGDSMDKAGINDGDLVLVKQQPNADNGQNVVALIDDEATIKEFRKEKQVVVLYPRSRNHKHKPIILDKDFSIQGIVVTTIPRKKVEHY